VQRKEQKERDAAKIISSVLICACDGKRKTKNNAAFSIINAALSTSSATVLLKFYCFL
jgi:hypothetical protein